MNPLIVTVIIWVVILVGLIGTVIPALPGVGLIYFAILGYALYFGVETVGVTTLVVLGVFALLSFVFDILSSAYGAKYFGSTRYGVIGSIIGGVVGLVLFNIFGLMFGVFLGAALGEMLFAQKNMRSSLKAGFGSILGFLGGTLLKLILGIIMVLVFVLRVW